MGTQVTFHPLRTCSRSAPRSQTPPDTLRRNPSGDKYNGTGVKQKVQEDEKTRRRYLVIVSKALEARGREVLHDIWHKLLIPTIPTLIYTNTTLQAVELKCTLKSGCSDADGLFASTTCTSSQDALAMVVVPRTLVRIRQHFIRLLHLAELGRGFFHILRVLVFIV